MLNTTTKTKSKKLIRLFRKYPEYFTRIISKNYILTEELLEKYKDCLDWKDISSNEKIPWSEALISIYENNIDWKAISKNTRIKWSPALIEKYSSRLDWPQLSKNPGL